jgi:hypothetical protein
LIETSTKRKGAAKRLRKNSQKGGKAEFGILEITWRSGSRRREGLIASAT